MKITSLLVMSSIAAAGVAGVFLFQGEKKMAAYKPIPESTDASYLDAVHYLRLLRGNLNTGDFEVGDYEEMAHAVNVFNRNHTGERSLDLSWWEMGPNNVGGRTRAICAVTNDLIFAGSVTGGLYKSINGGNNWERVESLDAFGKTMAISCIDRTGDGSIYIGTGSKFESGGTGSGESSSIGVGLYRSTDLGQTWTLVPGTEPTPFGGGDDWAFINDICADPTNPNRIWIAGQPGSGYYDAGSGELNMDLDGIPSSAAHDVEWSPNGAYVLVGISNGRVYKSGNGASFDQIGSGILTTKQRVRIAISPDDPSQIYVLYAESNFMGGLFYSGDSGASWQEKWPSGVDNMYSVFGDNGQAYYDLALAVKPGDPGVAWIGGVTLWQGGANTQPEQIAFNFDLGSSELYVHSDIHTFEFAPNGDWYIGCDGGVFKSVDGGQTFAQMNRGYVTTQFYGIGHGGGFPVVGGAQDNSTQLIPGMEFPAFQTDSWQQGIQIQGGDGFDCDLSNVTYPGAEVAFATSQYGALGRYNAQGAGGAFYDDEIVDVVGLDGEVGPFYSVIRLFENTADEDAQQNVILFNNRNFDLYSYVNDENETVWLDTTLYTASQTLPFAYRFPVGDTLHFWETLVRPEIWSTEELTTDPNYPWLEPQELTQEVDSCITDSIIIGYNTVIDEIIEETLWVYWEDSVFVPEIDDYFVFSDSSEIVLSSDTTYMEVPEYEYTTICTTWYFYESDVLENVREQWLVQDQFSSMLVTAFSGNQGLWLTRQALNFNVTPDWWKLTNAPTTGVRTFEFTDDGTTLFYSSWGGQLFRIKNLDELWSEDDVANLEIEQLISNAGGTITSIASDPNNINHLVITIGGYGNVSGGKVRESNNAMAANPTFSNNIWDFTGDEAVLEKMPVFASIIDVSDPSGNTILVGTDFGIWATDDGGDTWEHSGGGSDGIPAYPQAGPGQGTLQYVPVFDLRQQQVGLKPYMNPENYGTIYAGTHGRGIWRSDDFYSVDVEELQPETDKVSSLLIFPNPTEGEAYLNVELTSPLPSGQVSVYSIQGKLVHQFTTGRLVSGTNRISLQAEELAAGNYIVRLDAGSASGVGKFIRR